MIGDEVFIPIKKYGKVKVTSGANARGHALAKASQTTFKALRGTDSK